MKFKTKRKVQDASKLYDFFSDISGKKLDPKDMYILDHQLMSKDELLKRCLIDANTVVRKYEMEDTNNEFIAANLFKYTMEVIGGEEYNADKFYEKAMPLIDDAVGMVLHNHSFKFANKPVVERAQTKKKEDEEGNEWIENKYKGEGYFVKKTSVPHFEYTSAAAEENSGINPVDAEACTSWLSTFYVGCATAKKGSLIADLKEAREEGKLPDEANAFSKFVISKMATTLKHALEEGKVYYFTDSKKETK